MFRLAACLVAATSAVFSAGTHAAESFPHRPIQIVVPFATGGTTDILARIMADGMSKALGTSVVVENRAGATGIIGSEYVANAKPDGYTLGIATVSSHSVNPVVRKLRFDVQKDLVPVVNIANSPTVLVVGSSFPSPDFRKIIEAAKKEPGKYTFGMSGLGSGGHLKMELLKIKTGAEFLGVPYTGISPALQDAMAGRVDVVSDDLPSSLPFIQVGRLKAVAVANPRRLAELPDVPTYEELGIPEMNLRSWFGMVAPAGTPIEVIEKLNAAANEALKTEKVDTAIRKLAIEPAGGSAADFGKTWANDMAIQRQIARQVNIQLD
ncbi:Bug family tripartite tricarboxylate transporter substrate binding protein [Bordetella sp. 2513F-2]